MYGKSHFLGCPYHSSGSKIHLDAVLHYSRNKSLQQKSQLLTVQKQLLEVLCKKVVLRNFANFSGKHLCLITLQALGLRPATLLKKRLWHSCKFCKISKNIYFTEHLRTTASGLLFILYV